MDTQTTTTTPKDPGLKLVPPPEPRSVIGYLDAHKTLITAGLVSVVGFFYPPAQQIIQAYPDIATVAVSALFAGLHALNKEPGFLRR